MIIATLTPVTNRATWTDAMALFDEDDGTALDISAATEITLSIRDPQTKCVKLTATLSDATITMPETGVFQWTFSADDMRTLCAPKSYEVGCVIEIDDEEIQILIGVLPVLDGIIS